LDLRVALFLPSTANAYFQLVGQEARTAAAAAGITLDVHLAEHVVQQIQQIYGRLHAPVGERPAAVLVLPLQEDSLNRVIGDAAALGVSWICVNRLAGDIDRLREEHPKLALSLITPDHEGSGRIQAKQILALLPLGGRVLYVRGNASNASARERQAGFETEIGGSRIEVAHVLDGRWTLDDAERAVRSWLLLLLAGGGSLDGIVCQNDSMALGALHALEAVGASSGNNRLGSMPVVGCDGLPGIGQQLVDQGRLRATVVLPVTGAKAVEMAAAFLKGGPRPDARTILPASPYPAQLDPTTAGRVAAPVR
jgi:ABC-type sugar transport system substrate-binding protein